MGQEVTQGDGAPGWVGLVDLEPVAGGVAYSQDARGLGMLEGVEDGGWRAFLRRFVATERGRVVTAFLAAFFARWVACEFTAGLEHDLDRVVMLIAEKQG